MAENIITEYQITTLLQTADKAHLTMIGVMDTIESFSSTKSRYIALLTLDRQHKGGDNQMKKAVKKAPVKAVKKAVKKVAKKAVKKVAKKGK